MDRDNYLVLHKERAKKAAESAAIKTFEMNLPKEINLPSEIAEFGIKTKNIFQRYEEKLKEEHGDFFPKLISIALHEYWFSCWTSANHMAIFIEEEEMNRNEYTLGFTTASGYADREGWASTLAEGTAYVKPSDARVRLIKKVFDADLLDQKTLLDCMALYWFYEAAREYKKGNTEAAFNILHEAYDALILSNGSYMYEAATNEAIEVSGTEIRSALAKKAAEASHVDTRRLKQEVQEFWQLNIDKNISNDDAAILLMRQFPLKHRTLTLYVAGFKKTFC